MMSPSGNPDVDIAGKPEKWLAYIEDEIRTAEHLFERRIATIMKQFLVSSSNSATASAVKRLEEYYRTEYWPDESVYKFCDDKGMIDFLWYELHCSRLLPITTDWKKRLSLSSYLYDFAFDVGALLPFENVRHERLIQIVIGLAKASPFLIDKKLDDVFMCGDSWIELMGEHWNGSHGFRHLEDDHPRLKEECDYWINIAIFMARGATGGMANGKRPFSCEWDKYARHDIETCLEKELLPGTKKDCEVTVVAQYFLLAGSGLYERNVLKAEDGSKEKVLYLNKCQVWTSKIEQLLGEYEVEGKLKMAAMIKEAYEKMVALQSQPSLD